MKKQSIFILASLFFATSINGSFKNGSFHPLNSSIESEYPKAPCPSPMNNSTSTPSFSGSKENLCKTAESITTIPHVVSNSDRSPLDDLISIEIPAESMIESPIFRTTVKKINNFRYSVRINQSDRSPNWREDSCISPNNNAESIVLCLSKKELFEKTYLAAALRGKNNKQQK